MYTNQTEICNEQRKIIGIEPVIDMKNFVILLLADLASKSPIIHYNNPNIKTACLNIDYKKTIQDIMYEENGWGIEFASLINIYSYYEFQLEWEKKLGSTIKKVLYELNKQPELDFKNDKIRINFTEEEIKKIKNRYDNETLSIMDHFSNLIQSSVFDRKANIEINNLLISDARYLHNLENLSLKTKYKNEIKLTKPSTKSKKKVKRSIIKKLLYK